MNVSIDLKAAIVFGLILSCSIICFGFIIGMHSIGKQKLISQENIMKTKIENDTQMLKTMAEVWGNCNMYKTKEEVKTKVNTK